MLIDLHWFSLTKVIYTDSLEAPVFRGESPWLWPLYLCSHMHTDAADLGLLAMFYCLSSGHGRVGCGFCLRAPTFSLYL